MEAALRARGIKPGLFKNEVLGAADPLYTLVFEGVWCIADREGRLEDRPLRIHAEVNPYRSSASTVQALDWLVHEGFLIRYESGGEKFLAVANFRKHQQPHVKEAPSKIPPPQNQGDVVAPDKHGASTGKAALTSDSGLLTPDSGLLTVDTPRASQSVVPRETKPPFDGWSFVDQRMRPAYPRGTFRHTHWINASKLVEQLVQAGADPDEIAANAAAYCAQQEAMGNGGTKFVLAPTNFLTDGNWRGPFPLPEAQRSPERETPMQKLTRALDDRAAQRGAINGEVLR